MLVYIPLILYWIILFTATTLPGNQLPDLGFSDKLEHFSAFFILAVLLNLTLLFQKKSEFLFKYAVILTILICMFYGAFDEIHQLIIPGRSADIRDWIADSSGVLLGVFILNLLKYLFNYKIKFD
jgi:VanZ family protein